MPERKTFAILWLEDEKGKKIRDVRIWQKIQNIRHGPYGIRGDLSSTLRVKDLWVACEGRTRFFIQGNIPLPQLYDNHLSDS